MGKVAAVAPSSTVTRGGAVTEARLVESATTSPPAGAGALRVAVPVDGCPLSTEEGSTVR
jgi:hypothetical protein